MKSFPFAFCALLGSVSCARHGASPADLESPPVGPSLTTIRRTTFYPIADLEARGQGRLYFVLRSADHPTVGRSGAEVRIRLSESDPFLTAVTDSMGIARFEAVPSGTYRLTLRSFAVPFFEFPVPVTPGCETDAEAYVGIMSLGIAPPPAMRTRVVITTCPAK